LSGIITDYDFLKKKSRGLERKYTFLGGEFLSGRKELETVFVCDTYLEIIRDREGQKGHFQKKLRFF